MSEKVSFTEMLHGTREDYDLVFAHEAESMAQLPERLIGWLGMMEGESPYQISRLYHCLQTATRAEVDGADDEMVACALLHDIGDVLGPANHSEIAAALLRPYVTERSYWIVKHHGLFQGYYYRHHFEQDRHARDVHADHPYYEACIDFCARWDQTSFDPDYPTKPLAHFEPLIHDLFRSPRNEFV